VLIVGYEKSVAIDGRGRIVEGIGFAVEPASFGLIGIVLILDGDVGERRSRETAAQPKVVSAGRIVGDVVVGGQGAGVDRQRADDRAVKGADCRARYDAADGVRTGEGDRDERRAPIGMTVVVFVFEGGKGREVGCDAIVELGREAGQIAEIAVDEAVQLDPTASKR